MESSRRALGLTVAAGPALGALAGHASAADRRVAVINDTNVVMVEFNVSNVGSQSWEEDILDQEVLGAGERVTVNINDGTGACKFDLRAVFEDKDVVIRRNFNICEETSWRICNR